MRKLLAMSVAAFAVAATLATTATATMSYASWYGPGLYGNGLACGGRLTTGTWGVAHKTLPCGTRLVLCYRRCVQATVIDRGPYVRGRDFDLTFPVKQAIGMPSTGLIHWYLY